MNSAPIANTGSFGTEALALEAVVSRMVDQLDPEYIWLFGSRAEGRSRPDSDFDLLVVTKREDGELADDYEYVYGPVLGTGVGCDVLPCPIDDFVRELQNPNSLVSQILERGVKLYDRRQGRNTDEVGARPSEVRTQSAAG
jgi:hypothetical protein